MRKHTLFFIAVVLVFAAFSAVGCNTTEEVPTYNIVGTWNIALTDTSNQTEIWQITFMGGTSNGTATDTYPFFPGVGIYSITASQITITMNYLGGTVTVTYTGTITSDNYMSGNWVSTGGPSGTWLATR